jgi:hypothetical protein
LEYLVFKFVDHILVNHSANKRNQSDARSFHQLYFWQVNMNQLYSGNNKWVNCWPTHCNKHFTQLETNNLTLSGNQSGIILGKLNKRRIPVHYIMELLKTNQNKMKFRHLQLLVEVTSDWRAIWAMCQNIKW